MAYHNQKLSHPLKQELGFEYIEIEFVQEEKEVLPVEEKPKSTVYKLSAPISKKALRKDRKSRRKSSIQFNRPVSNFSVAQSRISY